MSKISRVVGGVLILAIASNGLGSELKPVTAKAFDKYVKDTESRIQTEVSDPPNFLYIDSLPGARRPRNALGCKGAK